MTYPLDYPLASRNGDRTTCKLAAPQPIACPSVSLSWRTP